MEVNVSDIVSMGGTPTYAFISLALTKDTEVEFMDELYRGIYASADKHGVALIGGDTTHGAELVTNIALLGEVDKDFVRLRSDARPGELICVTGTLGKSAAGLNLLLKGMKGDLKGYLEPECRLAAEGRAIARHARAMIDVSDGLGSEVAHICEESGTGARIDQSAIPLSASTREAARILSMDPHEFALYGGEDFELVFTLPADRVDTLRKDFSDFTVVGEVLGKEEGIYILKDGKKEKVRGGYNHFAG
jgi:thiamine-monophosphate kinase